METFTIKHLSFSYPEREKECIKDLNLTVQQGEFLVLCGPSGCGKSTLLRQLKTILKPHGKQTGEVLFEGRSLEILDRREQAQRIGFVQQNPDNQIVTDKVWHELAFGLESLGYDTTAIRKRVAEMASYFGIEGWFYRDVAELSGGQKQLLNLAAIMVMQPSVLILDEPTSQLDPIAASEFLATIAKINQELGTTIILTEHRLEEAAALASRMAVMDKGRILCSGTVEEVGQILKNKGHGMFLAMPTAMCVWGAVETDTSCPITIRDGNQWLKKYAAVHSLKTLPEQKKNQYSQEYVIRADNVWFRYAKNMPDIVRGLNLEVRKGEFLVLLGGNGTGKSTSLKLLAGLMQPYRGEIERNGTVGILPQNPQSLFVKKSVREELYEILEDKKLSVEKVETEVAQIASLCRLEELLDRHPYDLSGGEQQRTALAKILLLNPKILFLDEPTKGMDAEFKQIFAEILQQLLKCGVTILMVSHDLEFCAQYAHRCALFFDGGIVSEGPPRTFFSGNRFYTTAANRMAHGINDEVVTAEELIAICGGKKMTTVLPKKNIVLLEPVLESAEWQPKKEKHKLSKRTLLATVLILCLIPLTLFVGETYLGGRKYLWISLLIMVEMMLPFFMIFESRKPQARELVIIAVLCALGVAGRAAFFMLPEFKPVWAITIISGVAFGGETGFLVGAMTMLVSNVLFGQGPWTPWQMFAMGIIGFLAGVLFKKGLLQRNKLSLCIFGAFSCIVIYGGIMNPAAALMWSNNLNQQLLLSYFITGFPVDCIHAVSTWIFLWFIAEPMLEKLDRVKVKYGLVE